MAAAGSCTPAAERFRRFARLEARHSSALYALLASELADRPHVLALLDVAESRQRRPNLLFAAVHDLLLSGVEHELATYYPSVGGNRDPDAHTTDLFIAFVDEHRVGVMERLASRSTQTNEVRRAALLRPVLHRIARDVGGSLGLIEVGASAGLLLQVDGYTYDDGGQRSGPIDPHGVRISCRPTGPYPSPTSPPFRVGTRVGIDRNPLDAADPHAARWLQACVWPEHIERRRLLDDALAVAAERPAPLLAGDALDLLPAAVDKMPSDDHVVVFHAATLTYFPAEDRQRFVDLLRQLSRSRPVSWVSLEAPFLTELAQQDDEHELRPPVDSGYFLVGLAHLPEQTRLLARGDPHGTWIQWLADDT